MKLIPFILALCLLLPVISTAKEIVLKHKFMEGTLFITVDDSKIEPELIKKYLLVHPIAYDSSYHIAPSLLLCIDKDPRYFSCGKRDFKSENFIKNAEVNIAIALKNLAYLDQLNAISSLNNLVAYFRSSLAFGIWKNKQLLSYYKSWNIVVLKEQYQDITFSTEAYESLRRLENTTSMDERWNISFYTWSNAVNNLYRMREGDIPRSEWDSFLKMYGISERIEWDSVD